MSYYHDRLLPLRELRYVHISFIPSYRAGQYLIEFRKEYSLSILDNILSLMPININPFLNYRSQIQASLAISERRAHVFGDFYLKLGALAHLYPHLGGVVGLRRQYLRHVVIVGTRQLLLQAYMLKFL